VAACVGMGISPSLGTTSRGELSVDQTILDKYSLTLRSYNPPKFDAPNAAAMKYLEDNGYVAFSAAASADEVKRAIDLFWHHVEATTSARRAEPMSWEFFGFGASVGILSGSFGNSEFLWYCRALPKVMQIFQAIWQTTDVLTSFDGCGAFRPPEVKESWLTIGNWYHIDQNIKYKPHRICVQGLLNLYASGPLDGGLVVIPGSHVICERFFTTHPELAPPDKRDFVKMTHYDCPELWANAKPVKLCLDAGDFVCWDSRTVHCNQGCTPNASLPPPTELRRLVAYICMTPTSFVTSHSLHKFVLRRAAAYQRGVSTTHWPHEFHPSSGPAPNWHPPVLSQAQRQLLLGSSHCDSIDLTKLIKEYSEEDGDDDKPKDKYAKE